MIGWGLVTDIGITAEKYRWLGENRYTLVSLLEIFRLLESVHCRDANASFGRQSASDVCGVGRRWFVFLWAHWLLGQRTR